MHIAASLLVMMLGLGAAQGTAKGFRWWLDPQVQQDLGLTREQVSALDGEYARTLAHRQHLRREFDAADAELARAFVRGDLPDEVAQVLVDRVEDLRRRRNVARLRLLVSMYFLLTREQRARFPSLVALASSRPH